MPDNEEYLILSIISMKKAYLTSKTRCFECSIILILSKILYFIFQSIIPILQPQILTDLCQQQ